MKKIIIKNGKTVRFETVEEFLGRGGKIVFAVSRRSKRKAANLTQNIVDHKIEYKQAA